MCGMSAGLTQVLAVLFLVVVAAAAIAVVSIAIRQRASKGTVQDRAPLAAELIQLEEELNYAEAFAASGSVAAANLAFAHSELNSAFAAYNNSSTVDGEGLAAGDANAVRTRLAIVREILANPAEFSGGIGVERGPSVLVDTQLSPSIGTGSRVFEVALWVLGIIPGAIFTYRKSKARSYFAALDQRIKANAAQIDVFLAQRAQILRSCPGYAGSLGLTPSGEARNVTNGRIDNAYQELIERAQATSPGERPPELKTALRADRNVQREITAARTLYNDTVNMWNRDIFAWPAKMMVATEAKLATRPVFVASQLSPAVGLSGV